MRVLLVNPPMENTISLNVPEYIEELRAVPPLGILYVAAYLKTYGDGVDVRVLDAHVENLGLKEVEREMRKLRPDIVGITCTTFTLLDVLAIAKVAKSIDERIKVVLGGPHVNIFPEETLAFNEVDYIVLGEGELTFTELVRSLMSGGDLSKVPGLVYKSSSGVVNTGFRGFITDLDSLPFPARHLTPYKKYRSIIGDKVITNMITSRGCPYRCIFCYRPHLGKKFRARSPRNVVDEMEVCEKMGIEEILMYDDTFNCDEQRVLEICKEVKERGLRVKWDIRARVDKVNAEMMKALSEAGCIRIHFGVESGSQRVLENLRKDITLDQALNAFKLAREHGIETVAYFMLGNPGEGVNELRDTLKFAFKLDPDYCLFSILTPYPGTPLYKLGLEKGLFTDYWREFAAKPSPDFTPPAWEEFFTRKELTHLLNYVYRRFYLRPTYILKRLLKIRSWEELLKTLKVAGRIAFSPKRK